MRWMEEKSSVMNRFTASCESVYVIYSWSRAVLLIQRGTTRAPSAGSLSHIVFFPPSSPPPSLSGPVRGLPGACSLSGTDSLTVDISITNKGLTGRRNEQELAEMMDSAGWLSVLTGSLLCRFKTRAFLFIYFISSWTWQQTVMCNLVK